MTKIRTPEPIANTAASRLMQPSVVPMVHRATPTNGATQSTRKPRRTLTPTEQRQRAADRDEMQSLLAKLKQLVPGIPKKRKMSKLEIIQHVIDYIFDLQVALESHPIAGAVAPEFLGFQAPNHQGLAEMAASFIDANQFDCAEYSLPQQCDSSSFSHYHQQHQSQFHPQMTSQRISSSTGRPERQPLASIML